MAQCKHTLYVSQMIEGPDGCPQQVQVHIGESPLSWLHARGLLSDRLYDAGEQLRRDWESAGLGPRITMRWDAAPRVHRSGSSGAHDLSARQLSAHDRFHAALHSAGNGLADILWRVACAGEGLGAAEKALGWPNRSGKLVLSFALERVADYYRLP